MDINDLRMLRAGSAHALLFLGPCFQNFGAVAHYSFFPGNRTMLKLRKGFTLIELLIVVVIIGILAAIAIPKFANTKIKAYMTAMKSDLRNLVTAEEAFFSDSVKYSNDDRLDARQVLGVDQRECPDRHAGYGLLDGDRHALAACARRLRHRHEHDEPDGHDGERRRAGL